MLLFPRIAHVGGGASRLLPQILHTLQLQRPLLVTDPFLYQQSTMVTDLLQHWKQQQQHQESSTSSPLLSFDNVPIFYETVPDPTSNVVKAGVEKMKQVQPDCLVAIGGGSPIDTAKAMAVGAAAATSIDDDTPTSTLSSLVLPIIAIPTTAGTGSEMTRFSVITQSDTGEKKLLAAAAMQPTAALVDYELTLDLPPRVTADTGIDALTHAVEAFVSRRRHEVADVLCREAVRLIGGALRPSYDHAKNGTATSGGSGAPREARQDMMRAASLAGLAFNHSSVALVHGMSRPLGAHFHWTHGASNAVLFPTLTRWSMDSPALERYAVVALELCVADSTHTDTQAATRLVDELLAINRDLSVPTLRQGGIDSSAWENMIPTMAQQALASGSPNNNPRIPTVSEIEDLYRLAYEESW